MADLKSVFVCPECEWYGEDIVNHGREEHEIQYSIVCLNCPNYPEFLSRKGYDEHVEKKQHVWQNAKLKTRP